MALPTPADEPVMTATFGEDVAVKLMSKSAVLGLNENNALRGAFLE